MIVSKYQCPNCEHVERPATHTDCSEGGGGVIQVGDGWQCGACGESVDDDEFDCVNCGQALPESSVTTIDMIFDAGF